MNKKIQQFVFIGGVLSILAGCATTEDQQTQLSGFDHELYDGKSTLGLSGDFPPASPQEAIARGDQAYLAQDADLALYEYIRALSFPSQEEADIAYYKVGYIHQQRGNYDLARLAYERASLANPNNSQYLTALGNTELKLGNKESAKTSLTQAIVLDQKRQSNSVEAEQIEDENTRLLIDAQSPLNAYNALGVICDLETKHLDAQKLYKLGLNQQPRDEKLLNNYAYSLYMNGDLNQAENIYKRITKLNSQSDKAWSNLGLIYIRKGQYNAAYGALKHAMKPEAAYNDIGYFAMLEGDYEAAIHFLQKAIDASPTYYITAQENLAQAKQLQVESPRVKASKTWDNNQFQSSVYAIDNRIE
ncbi:tetratricopeptide repeat protein [Thaumasiovibrio sp. DFM-14]|uniref:tetratricopeptide repeat protein n=1 Tax=Thaumasiovibrio sp. DFM-14 TaxID=3384792 RepID=UPI0039A27BCC